MRRSRLVQRIVLLGLLALFLPIALSLAQPGQVYVAPAETTLKDVARQFFGDPGYWTGVMGATNRKHIVDPSFALIENPELPIKAGTKLWIPTKAWADRFMWVCYPDSRVFPQCLFGGGQLVVASWWTAGGEAEGLAALFEIYKREAPDVQIVNATIAGGAGFVFRAVIKPRIIAGNPPDTFQLHAGLEVEGYEPEKYLKPLDDLYALEGWDKVFPKDLLDLLRYKGHYWGVPVNIHRSNVLWYNKEIFAANGLTPPASWDDFFRIADTLKAKGIAPIVLGNAGGWEAPHAFEDILAGTCGAEKYRGLWTGAVPWTDACVTDALNVLKRILDYVNPDYAAHTWDTVLEYLATGKGAMNIMGDWAMGWFMAKGVDIGWAPPPGTKGIYVALSDSFSFPIAAPNAANVPIWLAVCGSKEGQIAFNMRKGSIPARTDITPAEKAQFNPYLQSAMDDWARDAIVPSVIHGAAAIESWVTDFKDVINLFLVRKDVAAAQNALVEAAIKALETMGYSCCSCGAGHCYACCAPGLAPVCQQCGTTGESCYCGKP
jgi:glucose/mannose transport system substrate-binding protein